MKKLIITLIIPLMFGGITFMAPVEEGYARGERHERAERRERRRDVRRTRRAYVAGASHNHRHHRRSERAERRERREDRRTRRAIGRAAVGIGAAAVIGSAIRDSNRY